MSKIKGGPTPAKVAKIRNAVKAAKKAGISIMHSWGQIEDQENGGYYKGFKAMNKEREYNDGATCPMGAVIVKYDDVDGLGFEEAAAKILGTSGEAIETFISAFDGGEEYDEEERTDAEDLAPWYDLGVKFRKYAE